MDRGPLALSKMLSSVKQELPSFHDEIVGELGPHVGVAPTMRFAMSNLSDYFEAMAERFHRLPRTRKRNVPVCLFMGSGWCGHAFHHRQG